MCLRNSEGGYGGWRVLDEVSMIKVRSRSSTVLLDFDFCSEMGKHSGAAAAAAATSLQSCPTLCDPHGLQPTRLPRPWDSPGKNTGVGCHFLLQCMKVKSESEIAQSCPT